MPDVPLPKASRKVSAARARQGTKQEAQIPTRRIGPEASAAIIGITERAASEADPWKDLDIAAVKEVIAKLERDEALAS